jgi:hypothetical protein
MTLQDKMEEISQRFFEVLATKQGYKTWTGRDNGVDLELRPIVKSVRVTKKGKTSNRYLDNGRNIDIQLKSVLSSNITMNDAENRVHFNAEVKTYNDLVERKDMMINDPYSSPLILILVIFPENFEDSVILEDDHMILRKYIYWYKVESTATTSGNEDRQVIHIPYENKVNLDFFDEIFVKAFED